MNKSKKLPQTRDKHRFAAVHFSVFVLGVQLFHIVYVNITNSFYTHFIQAIYIFLYTIKHNQSAISL